MHQNCIRHGRHRSDNFCLSIQFILQWLHLWYYYWKQRTPHFATMITFACFSNFVSFRRSSGPLPTRRSAPPPPPPTRDSSAPRGRCVGGRLFRFVIYIHNGFHNRRRSSLSALSTTRPTTTGRRSPSTSPSTTTPRSRSRPSG